MCLVALAIGQRQRFPLVIAANRDEFRARPAQALGWWSPGRGAPAILGGRDLRAGGTWLGLTAAGRLALLTNIRDPARYAADAPSRGDVVPMWLRGDLAVAEFCAQIAESRRNGFNLIAADFARGECVWASNRGEPSRPLEHGLWGLSNAGLDTPWPKVEALKREVGDAIATAADADALARRLFDALGNRNIAADVALPNTGVPRDWERALSAAFIDLPSAGYGTRCSTVLITERIDGRVATQVFERSFDDGGQDSGLRCVTLPGWPPRAADAQSDRTISTCGMAASSNTVPRVTKPART